MCCCCYFQTLHPRLEEGCPDDSDDDDDDDDDDDEDDNEDNDDVDDYPFFDDDEINFKKVNY
jgi:hypothetical protein